MSVNRNVSVCTADGPGITCAHPPAQYGPARPRAEPGSRAAAPSASMTGVMMRALLLRGRGEAR